MSSPSSPPDRDALPLWKRAIDIFCCLVAFPVFALIALWTLIITQIAAPGPVFFRQERIGHKGRRFFLYKFRTMHVSASVSPHQAHFTQLMRSKAPMEKLDARRDKRLIPGGWLLRASGLDELPQVINVLRGEMSIVGPRPCIPYEFEQYSEWERHRFGSVPGLTGSWQVSGKNRTTFDEMVRLDIKYGEALSFAEDMRIILCTLPALWIQVSDTRKARRATEQLSAPTAAQVVAEAPLRSATTLLHSHNVTGALDESLRAPVLPARAAMVAYQPAVHASPASLRIDSARSTL